MNEQTKLKLRYKKSEIVIDGTLYKKKGGHSQMADVLDTGGISTTIPSDQFGGTKISVGELLIPESVEIVSAVNKALTTDYHAITFFDLFAGIGGFRIGLERLGWRCVGFCEFNKYCVETYRANHDTRGEFYHSDATDIKTESMPDFDILVGGFPCQAFSLAGHRKGFEDTRGTLFFEAARIIKDKQPKAFILENVKGLTLMSRNTNKFKSQGKLVLESKEFDRIIEVLRMDLGYQVFFKVLNSKNFGVPQNRERVFIVGFRPDIKIDFPGFQYPEGEPTTLRLKDILEPSVPERYYIQGKNVVSTVKGRPNIYPSGYVSGIVSSQEDLSRTLFPGESGGSIPHVEEDSISILRRSHGEMKEIDGKTTPAIVPGTGNVAPKVIETETAGYYLENKQVNRNTPTHGIVYKSEGISPVVRGKNETGIIVAEGKLDGREYNALSTEGVSKTVLDGHGFQVPKIQMVEKGEHQQHNVYSSGGISPSLVRGGGSDTNKKGGGVSQRFAPKIEVIGEPHFGKTEVNPEGISPTVRDNHGDSPARIEIIGNYHQPGNTTKQSGDVVSTKGIAPTLANAHGEGMPKIQIEGEIYARGGNVLNTEGISETVRAADSQGGRVKIVVEGTVDDYGKHSGGQIISPEGISPTVLAAQKAGHGSQVKIAEIEKLGEIAPDKGGDKKREQGWSVYSDEGISPTVMAGMGEGGGNVPMLPTPQKRIRRLTPRECLRLQGFPDTFKIVVSDTQAYKQAGNAVTTTVITAVGRAMERYLK